MDDAAPGQSYLRRIRIVFVSLPPSDNPFDNPFDDSPLDTPYPWTAAPAGADDGHSSKRARVGATSEDILLGLHQVTACRSPSSSGEDCAICLHDLQHFRADDDETTQRISAMPCSHAFHHHCISEWLRLNAVCPLCRHPLLMPTTTPTSTTPEVDEEDDEEWEDGGVIIS